MARNIKGNGDGPNGRNDTYSIPGRGSVARPVVVREVKEGQHPGHGTVTVDGVEYVRSNPDRSRRNNVND